MDERDRPSLWTRFVARRRARLAVAVLALLYAAALFAPLVANDRPFVLEAVHVKEYRTAHKTLVPSARAVERLLRASPEQYAAARTVGSELSQAQAVSQEARALAQQIAAMRRALSAADHGPLDALDRELATALAQRDGSSLVALAQRAHDDLRPRDASQPDANGRELLAVTSYPLAESLAPWEVFCMALAALAVARLAWVRAFDRSRTARAAPRSRVPAVCVVALSLGTAIAWSFARGSVPVFATANYKVDISSGDLVVRRAVFPPIAMGFAETNLSESYRAPTWSARARATQHATPSVQDPRRDMDRTLAAVDVRYGEPPADSAWRHPLGTDSVGRDLLVRILWGGRVSLAVGLVSALLLTLIGTLVGALAGYFGGTTDFVASRAIEVVLCVPAFFLILMAVAFTDPDALPPLFAIAAVIAFVGWTGVARLVRAEILRLREVEFVLAARALGFSHMRILFAHILPNALGPVLVAGAFAIASGVLTESALAYLGFGIAHPVPSWGALASESHSAEHWWLQLFPGLLIFVTVIAYNLAGESLRDALDPRLED